MSLGEDPQPSADPLIAQVVADRYRILRKLGEGGMGSVYLAEHVVIEKKMALKVLAPELARRSDLVARFLQEARSASRIGHENVIDISDFGQSEDGLVYIAMEFLDGEDLGAMVRSQGAMAWAEAREIVLQICRALRAAHDKGIVHRDMKPENIFLIRREGQPHFVKILDFGIAKVMGLDPNGPRLTRTGMIFGTPEYMAPEQAEGKDTDHRADIYAVGCILYHLLTGQTPFIADSFMTMLTKHLMEDPVPPSMRRPDLVITPEMDALVLKALEKDRDRRWQSMAELLDAVSACPVVASRATRPQAGRTMEMGGADLAGAMGVVQKKVPSQETEKVVRRPVPSGAVGLAASSGAATASRAKTLVLIAAGVALGVGVAAWLALSHGDAAKAPPAAPPTAVVPAPPAPSVPTTPAPSPAAVAKPPAVAEPEAVLQPADEPRVAEPRSRRAVPRARVGTRHPDRGPGMQVAPDPAPGIPTPRELKPFPTP